MPFVAIYKLALQQQLRVRGFGPEKLRQRKEESDYIPAFKF